MLNSANGVAATSLKVRVMSINDLHTVEKEHQVQFTLFNELRDAVIAGRNREDIESLLDQWGGYTSAHFMSEQLLMRMHDYPDYESHENEHDNFMEQALALQTNYLEGRINDPSVVTEALRARLAEHMERMDSKLIDYLGGK